ncbi:MAG: hypothetical protein RIF41_21665 [Polyangiaceae bacterium]
MPLRRSLLSSCLLMLGLAALGARMTDAHAEPPSAPSAPVPLTEQLPSREVTPAPEAEEWNAAKRVRLARPLPSLCEAHLLREWLRIRCTPIEGIAAGAAVLSGDVDEVRFSMTRSGKYGWDSTTEVVMPLRRGDRRIVQLTRTNGGHEGIFTQDPLLLVSADWLDETSGPVVTPTPTVVGGPFRGLTIGDRAEAEPVAKKEGVELKWEAPWVVAIAPGSAADEAGVKLGDKFVNEGLLVFEDSAEAAHRDLVFAEGDTVKVSVMRGKQAKIIPFWLPIGPTYE